MLFRETAERFYYNADFSRRKPAHMPHMPHVHPLSCKLDWTTQKQFYCFLLICFFFLSLKPIRGSLVPGFPRALPSLAVMRRRALGSRLY